ncbi:MAG: hypothetical protein IKV59_05960 [Lachnospiraceae bacterium]|nr:hypothetical protein [Lachnospiraceae bacterium]
MIRVTDIKLTAEQIAGVNDGSALAVGISDGYEYADGKRTEKQTHKKVEAVMPNNKYEKIMVKVAGEKHPLTAELIAQNGGTVKVKFKNLTGKFYRSNGGDYMLSCTASAVEVVA